MSKDISAMPDTKHIIQKGDTLWDLALRYYGSGTLWKVIQAANKGVAVEPRRLESGEVLIIPGAAALWHRLIESINENRKKYQVYTPYLGSDESSASSPYLIPPLPGPIQFQDDIPVEIENIYQPAEISGTPPEFKVGGFEFAWLRARARTRNPRRNIKAVIKVEGETIWRAHPDAQESLRNNFFQFCARVEQLELEDTIIPGGTALIHQRLAEALPATLLDSLFFRYGFNHGFSDDRNPYVDLHPGMRLRVESSVNQFVEPGSPLNGPVHAGQSLFHIGRDKDQRIVFDSFLGGLAGPQIKMPDGARSITGLIELHAAGSARRHYRLFYPSHMPGAGSSGSQRVTENMTLVGADSLHDLLISTETYLKTGELDTAAAGNLPLQYTMFRGRVTAVPEIGIHFRWQLGTHLHESYHYVPLGTTVGQFLDRFVSTWNPRNLQQDGTPAVSLKRFWGEAVGLQNQPGGLPGYRPVDFNPKDGLIPDIQVYDLPLVLGDILEIRLRD
jgi:phage tail protein X